MKVAAIIEYGNQDAIQSVRPLHREYLGKLHDSGHVHAAGPFENDSGALIIYEVESVEQAEQLFLDDPFRQAGVFQRYELRPWTRVF